MSGLPGSFPHCCKDGAAIIRVSSPRASEYPFAAPLDPASTGLKQNLAPSFCLGMALRQRSSHQLRLDTRDRLADGSGISHRPAAAVHLRKKLPDDPVIFVRLLDVDCMTCIWNNRHRPK
jgi:hypothetical protein